MPYQDQQTAVLSIETQGDTGTPSIFKCKIQQNDVNLAREVAVRIRVCNLDALDNSTNATIAVVTAKGEVVRTIQAGKDLEFRSQLDTKATETLTFAGVVIDGEDVDLGSKTYEFDDDGNVGVGNVAVDISGTSVKAAGKVTIAEDVTIGDTFQIGDKTYVVVADGTAGTEGEISEEANEAAFKIALVAAVNGTDHNTANALITAAAFSGDDCILTSKIGGVIGNAAPYVTAEIGQGFTDAANIFDAGTLGTEVAGVDCTAAAAVTALALAITTDATADVTGVDGTGDTVDVEAKVAGTVGNALASTESMANGSFGDTTLSGGLDGLVNGEVQFTVTNAVTESVTVRSGPPEFGGSAVDYSALAASLDLAHAAP